MLDYNVTARRIDSHRSEAGTKGARIVLDTDMAGRRDAFNPAELALANPDMGDFNCKIDAMITKGIKATTCIGIAPKIKAAAAFVARGMALESAA